MKYKNSLKVASAAILAASLYGCATIVSGTSQPINVQAISADSHQTVPGAVCTLKDKKGRVYSIPTNPGSVTVAREYGGLQAHCVAKNYQQKSVGVGNSFNAWTLVDVLFWPGIIVDAATGAVEKYPSHITVLMEKKPGA
ncbi:MAG: hypothetical protein GY821_15960 [Gammaproteobacteria bacterium]|nr:hypothetical protein [Gammaproteobacteria bacterium]